MKSSRSGWPDIEAFKDKQTVFIEAKSINKKAKALQEHIHDRLRKQGFQVFVIDTWEQYLQIKYHNL